MLPAKDAQRLEAEAARHVAEQMAANIRAQEEALFYTIDAPFGLGPNDGRGVDYSADMVGYYGKSVMEHELDRAFGAIPLTRGPDGVFRRG